MRAKAEWLKPLKQFVERSDASKAFLALDLDGTALLEDHGKVFISSSVEKGVRQLHDRSFPVLLNTLRFPLSVIKTLGHAWYQIADAPIPTVLLNGSVLGYIKCNGDDLSYDEIAAFPMSRPEIRAIIDGVSQLRKAGIDEVLLFCYSRDWKAGETVWTPKPERIPGLKKKYVSASRIVSGNLEELLTELEKKELCMASLFIDRPEDLLMAYQHGKRNNFLTTEGVNKASGLCKMAKKLNLLPIHALGAGDTEMDTFLSEVGFAIIVGDAKLPFRGQKETVRVATPQELGEVIEAYADLLSKKSAVLTSRGP